jgi:hypothetical protein
MKRAHRETETMAIVDRIANELLPGSGSVKDRRELLAAAPAATCPKLDFQTT